MKMLCLQRWNNDFANENNAQNGWRQCTLKYFLELLRIIFMDLKLKNDFIKLTKNRLNNVFWAFFDNKTNRQSTTWEKSSTQHNMLVSMPIHKHPTLQSKVHSSDTRIKKSFEFLHFCLWSFGLWLREFSQHGKNFILQKGCALAMLKQTEMLTRSTCIFWTSQFFCIFNKWRQCCKCLLRSKVLDCLHRVYLVHAALGRVFLSPTIHSYLSLILRSWTAEPSACQLIVRLSNEYPRPFKTFHNRFHFMPFVCAPWAGASWSLSFESLITS